MAPPSSAALSWTELIQIYGHTPRLLAGGAVWQGLSLLDTVRLLRQAKGLPLMEAKQLATEEHNRALASPRTEWTSAFAEEVQGQSGRAQVLAQLGHFPTVCASHTPVYRAYFMTFSSEYFGLSIERNPEPQIRFVGTKPFALLEGGALADEELLAVVFDPWTELAVWTEQCPVGVELVQALERTSTRLWEPTVPRVGFAVVDGTIAQAEVYEGSQLRSVSVHSPTVTHDPGQTAFFQSMLTVAASALQDLRSITLIQEAQRALLWEG